MKKLGCYLLMIYLLILFIIPCVNGQKYSGGVDFGLIKMLTKVEDSETGVFITHQSVSYAAAENVKRVYLKYHDKFVYEIDYTIATYSNYICTENNFLPPFMGKECSGSDFIANQINVSIGKKVNLIKSISLEPSIGFGFVFFEDFSEGYQEDGPGSGGGAKWHYKADDAIFRENNLNLNASVQLLYNVNPILDLKLFYNYQQGVFKIYENKIVAWNPDDIEVFQIPEDKTKLVNANSHSNGSNTQFGLGIEFKFGKKD
jgi:hypothetical protein